MSYYYLCSYPLLPGSIVQKGNWGRIMRLEKISQNSSPYLLRELIFEKVRINNYQNKPSRFESIFICPNLDSAKEFKRRERPFDILYEVELLNTSANSFETDWSLIKKPNDKTIIQIEEKANKYWSGNIACDNTKEVIFDSNIYIIRGIEC